MTECRRRDWKAAGSIPVWSSEVVVAVVVVAVVLLPELIFRAESKILVPLSKVPVASSHAFLTQ